MQKFIITLDGELRFGDVHLHKDLLPLGEIDCFGGGFWDIDEGGMAISLHGRSFDFGPPNFEELQFINWEGVGGQPVPLIYHPNFPEKEGATQITVQ